MKYLSMLFTSLTLLASLAHAGDRNLICVGQDAFSRSVEVQWNEYIGNEQRAEANVTLKIGNRAPVRHEGLGVFIDSEGGFDFGVGGNDFSFLLILPPNMLDGKQIAGELIMNGVSKPNRRVILNCHNSQK